MKKVFLILLGLISINFISFSQESEKVVEFTKTNYELGEIAQNVPVTVDFNFQNIGNLPLIITNVVPSCGCSVADFPKSVIKPNESNTIKGTFNAAVLGTFSKSFTVNMNRGKPVILKISGKVVEKK